MILIKAEALNIYEFVYAARDLGAIRGAGLSLLGMPQELEKWLSDKYGNLGNEGGDEGIKRVTSGASKTTLMLRRAPASAQEIQTEIKSWLAEQYPYATIGVACADVKEGKSVLDLDEELLGVIRLEQMQSFSFARPTVFEGNGVCELDRVRPSSRETQRGDKSLRVSQEVFELRRDGYDLKLEFLRRLAGSVLDLNYTQDLTDLTKNPDAGRLNEKMAIFYADGNGFGSKPRAVLSELSSEDQIAGMEAFDKTVQVSREKFLHQLLARTSERRWQTDQGKRRIELLLWGGDELMLAIPAWCGWETAELFASIMKDSNATLRGDKEPLKYAMGLIFAHHKAPIHPLVQLVKKLAEDEAKDGRDINGRDGRTTHRLSYLVLESFDHVGGDLKRFRALQWRNREAAKGLVLSAEQNNLQMMRESLAGLKGAEFPRRKVYDAVKKLNLGKRWEEFEDEIVPFTNEPKWSANLATWRTATGKIESSWCHLADLWDYVAPEL